MTIALLVFMITMSPLAQNPERPRARQLGLVVGVLPPGPLNAITDVAGVAVGHTTIVRGGDIRTGVTAILPHTRNLFQEKVPGAVFVGNGFGKLAGSTQVNELGEIETPILLTSTLAVPRTGDAVIDYMLALPGNEDVRSINPVVGETNDGTLNDIRGRHIASSDVANAIKNAKSGPVGEGAVGAGTGTIAFGFKGGIGSSLLSNDAMSPLFQAVIEATEEAIYNSLFRAQTMTGRGRTIQALPLDKTLEILRRYNVIR
jgi:D-aminopeptidase